MTLRMTGRVCRAGFGALLLMLLASMLAVSPALAGEVTRDDYARAERMLGWNAANLVSGSPVDPQWIEEEDRFWYLKRVPGGHQFIYVDPAAGVQRPAFDHDRMAAAISLALGRAFVAHQLPFQELHFAEEGRVIEFWETEPATVTELRSSSEPASWVARVPAYAVMSDVWSPLAVMVRSPAPMSWAPASMEACTV